MLRTSLAALAALALVALAGCPEEKIQPLDGGGGSGGAGGGVGPAGGGGEGGGPPTDKWPLLACDPITPEKCGYPFPSNVYTVGDQTSPTGRRVSLQDDFFSPSKQGYKPLTKPWNKSDGFSAGSAILAYLPGAVDTGLPNADQVAETILTSSPTVIVDMASGELIPHWTETDHSTDNLEQRAILIHPAIPLRDGARYAVAIRGVEDAGGNVIEPSPAFRALRDGGAFDHPSIAQRGALYTEIFAALDEAGIDKADLQLAWDFTTASRENNTGWLLHMRDEAFDIVGPDGPAYTITDVQTDIDPANIAFEIHGTMEVPLYLDQPGVASELQFGADGMPEPNTATPTYEVEWELLIPQSALVTPAKLVQYGHGLLGSRTQIESGHFRSFCNTYNYAIFSVNLVGMAEDDENWIGIQVAEGKSDELKKMMDRLHQGMLNNLMGMRLMTTGMDADPMYGQYIDGSQRYYWGISQGGIMGGVLMSVSTDVERGVLEVMGQPYNTLLNRSVDFDPFFGLLAFTFPDARDQQLFLGTLQMLWDRVEPSGYTKYAVTDKLPGSPADRRILMRVALGDHQVTTYGGHTMARAMSAKHVTTGLREVWGLEATAGPVDETGATYFEYDFGLPPEPLCNVPMSLCDDPHGDLRQLDEARVQVNEFFTTGVASNTCPAGVCSHPELSGCTGMEDPNLCD